MITKSTHFIFILSLLIVSSNLNSQTVKGPSKMIKSNNWEALLDKDLSKWEIWTGVPQPSVQNLPSSYVVPEDGKPLEPIGLDNSMGVYSVSMDENNEPIVTISGEVYAGLTTLKSYSNYHLTLLFKWGEKKWAPRLDNKRDNGLLYHCHGEHGAFWDVWKSCLELQIQEGDFGDLYCLAGTSAKVHSDETNHWDPKSSKISKTAKRSVDAESSKGEWTRVDLYVIDDSSIHVVNGKVVLALKDALSKDEKKLSEGQIQIQSEGAEGFVKGVYIRPISKYPSKIRKAVGF